MEKITSKPFFYKIGHEKEAQGMFFAISCVWSCPAGPRGRSDHSVKGSGASALPLSLFILQKERHFGIICFCKD